MTALSSTGALESETTTRSAGVAAPVAGGRPPAYVVAFLVMIVVDTTSGYSRLLGFPLPPQRLLLGVGIVLLALDRRPWRRRRLRLRPVHVAAAVLLGWVLWSASGVGTLSTSLGFYAFLDRLAVPIGAFTFGPVIFATRRDRQLLLKVLTVLGLYLGVTGVFELFGPHALVFPRYIVDPSVGIQYGRARGPFAESEADGLTMTACAFAGGLLAWQSKARWRLAGVASAAASLLGVFLTLTRANWVGAGGAVLLTFVVVRPLRRWLALLVPTTLVAGVALLAFIPSLALAVTGRAKSERSVLDRYNTDNAALRIIDQHPLTGVGWERFIVVGGDYVRQASTYPITNVRLETHNVFLGRAAELGLPAALVFVLAIAFGPVRAILRRATGEFAGWRVVSLGVVLSWFVSAMLSPLPYSTPNLLFWLIPGVTLMPYLTRERSSGEDRHPVGAQEPEDSLTVGVDAVAGLRT